VQIHFMTINGGVDLQGGAGPFGDAICFDPSFCPNFQTIEDSHITGGVTINGYSGFWMGFFRNQVVGTVNLNNNNLVDPDGNEYQTNTIRGSLNCVGNSPAAQSGDSEGAINSVTGRKTGQCTAV